MKSPAVRAVLLLAAIYCGAGIVFGILAGRAASTEMRNAWRLAAWIVSAIAFGAHIAYEQVRLRSSATGTALHAASAAALGAFGLAVAANIHSLSVASHARSRLLVLSLALWPLLTMIPAFVVALGSAMVLRRVRPGPR